MTETKIRPMTLVDYIDPGSGVPVKACSPDNGQTYKIYFTPWGIVWHADDVEVLWNDFLLDKVKSVMSVDWDSIQNKPKFVTPDELEGRLAKLSVPTVKWADIEDKPPIPSIDGLVKETELADYAKKSDLPTMPDLSGYATVSSLIDYAKKSDLPDFSKYALKNELPITMAWQNITGKPDLATQDDLKNIELKPGPQGEPGTPGKDGVTPHIDSTTGDWFIGNQDTGTQAQGPAGKNGRDGADGQPGKDGQNGITPHIDTATGNWFVGSTDTGIKAQGPQGIQGVPGKDGRNGIDGKDGDRGPQGLPGANGKDGSPGAPGSPGRDGTDGKSAYQIWLDNGHSGTETDFLNSLKGAKGDPGQNGTNGQDGKDAIDTVKTITSGTLSSLSTGKYEIECWPSDTPIQEWGLCDVVVGQHYAKQVFTVTGATGDDQGNVYVRVRDYSGQWHEWRKITAWN